MVDVQKIVHCTKQLSTYQPRISTRNSQRAFVPLKRKFGIRESKIGSVVIGILRRNMGGRSGDALCSYPPLPLGLRCAGRRLLEIELYLPVLVGTCYSWPFLRVAKMNLKEYIAIIKGYYLLLHVRHWLIFFWRFQFYHCYCSYYLFPCSMIPNEYCHHQLLEVILTRLSPRFPVCQL